VGGRLCPPQGVGRRDVAGVVPAGVARRDSGSGTCDAGVAPRNCDGLRGEEIVERRSGELARERERKEEREEQREATRLGGRGGSCESSSPHAASSSAMACWSSASTAAWSKSLGLGFRV